MRVHLVQYNIAWEDKPANHAAVRSLLENARPAIHAGDLILLPEMFDTGFSLNVGVTADTEVDRPGGDPEPGGVMGVSTTFAEALAKHHSAWVIAGITLALRGHTNDMGEPMGINRSLVIDPEGRIAGHYDKVHPFTFGREGERFTPGNAVRSFSINAAGRSTELCPFVCYDLRFPELFRASLDLPNTPEVFSIIANWPAARAEHWRALCIARAIENLAFVIAVNRCGRDPHLEYTGGSIVVDPMGRVLAELPSPDPDAPTEGVLSADLDLDALRAWRSKFPALRDRRRWNATRAGGLAQGPG
ncbi:MAG: nitrilase-related carbon-nitrogen hydrolase [Phycisphaerales bacterium]